MKINQVTVYPNTLLLAEILDGVNLLLWSLCGKGNKPKSVASQLLENDRPKSDIKAFKTGADLLKERENIIKRINTQEDN